MSEPARQLEVRVGSATDALTPLSRATRSFAATRAQWLALAAIAVAAIVADQVTKHVVASHLSLGEGLHVAFENRPKAMPEFWTCRIVNGPAT